MRGRALKFVLLIGVVSLFADFTYEGSRSIVGPYLLGLGASAAAVGVITGFGELAGYGLRLVSGRWVDASKAFWPTTILGYVIQFVAVPSLALAGTWPLAAVLIILERVGKAVRNPPRDLMLSYAGRRIGGLGWAFGVHQALDQSGALIGPLVVSAVLALRHEYRLAFAVLAIPAVVCLGFLVVSRLVFPRPQELEEVATDTPTGERFAPLFWVYLAAAALAAAGFADYPLIAFHFAREHVVSPEIVPVFYAVAMASGGVGSLLLGRVFDRRGFGVLTLLTIVSAAFAPLVFFGDVWGALLGAALWGLGMGVHESIIPAAVAPMVPQDRRASAYGLFTAGYGVAWFLGSAAIGFLYDRSVSLAAWFCVLAQLLAVPFFIVIGIARRRARAEAS